MRAPDRLTLTYEAASYMDPERPVYQPGAEMSLDLGNGARGYYRVVETTVTALPEYADPRYRATVRLEIVPLADSTCECGHSKTEHRDHESDGPYCNALPNYACECRGFARKKTSSCGRCGHAAELHGGPLGCSHLVAGENYACGCAKLRPEPPALPTDLCSCGEVREFHGPTGSATLRGCLNFCRATPAETARIEERRGRPLTLSPYDRCACGHERRRHDASMRRCTGEKHYAGHGCECETFRAAKFANTETR